MRAALLALALILLAASCQGSGYPAIQGSSGIDYWVYDMEVTENQTTIWTDETTIEFLDQQENTTFIGV